MSITLSSSVIEPPIHHNTPSNSNIENIKCFLRCRPLTQNEQSLGANCLTISQDNKSIILDCSTDNSKSEKIFSLDEIFPPNITQEHIFTSICEPMLSSFLSGYNCTIFAYGQTGAGKTHTILGPLDALYDKVNANHGLVPRILDYLFNKDNILKHNATASANANQSENDFTYSVKCSCMEIYQEQLIDLLTTSESTQNEKLTIREDTSKSMMYVDNLTKVQIFDQQSAKDLLILGMNNRHVAITKMNAQSSRSHLIFTIFLEMIFDKGNGKVITRNSRLNVIDLAGSERQKSTQAMGDRIKEAGNINKSLSILGNVINALIDPKSKFVPFRDSKLTYLLKDSLGGSSKTMIIANISMSVVQMQETLSTLKFVQRAKMITNKAEINENVSDSMKILNLENEVKRLKGLLAKNSGNVSGNCNNCNSVGNNNMITENKIQELICKVNEFIGYEETITNKLKYLDLLGSNSIESFILKKQKFDNDIDMYYNNNSSSNDTTSPSTSASSSLESKISLLKQEIDLYKFINQAYMYKKQIDHCESNFNNEYISTLNKLHNELKLFFTNDLHISNINNGMMLVDKAEYTKMKLKLHELESHENEHKRTIETLENENFLINMELLKYKEDYESNINNYTLQDDICYTTNPNINNDITNSEIKKQIFDEICTVSAFSHSTPKKSEHNTSESNNTNTNNNINNSSSSKFISNLKKSLNRNTTSPINNNSNSKCINDELLLLKNNLDNAIKALHANENELTTLKHHNQHLLSLLSSFTTECNDIQTKLNSNDKALGALSFDIYEYIENALNAFAMKSKEKEKEIYQLEKYVLSLRQEKKQLTIELSLLENKLQNELNCSYSSNDIVNGKIGIMSKLKQKQSEELLKQKQQNEELLQFIFNNFNSNTSSNNANACNSSNSNKTNQNAIEILKHASEKIELLNFYINNQYKENTDPNMSMTSLSSTNIKQQNTKRHIKNPTTPIKLKQQLFKKK